MELTLPPPRKILLMYITQVSGHRQATMAIQRSLRQIMPDAKIKSMNAFSYTYPILEKVVNRAYMGVIKRTPKLWDYLYDNPKVVKRSERIKNFLHKRIYWKLEALFNEFQPDTVVCTQAFPCGMVADFKRTHQIPVHLIGVLTDHAPHSFWLNDGVDYYIVPSQDAKNRFLKQGIPEDMIKVFGIPIHLKFSSKGNAEAARKKLGLDPHLPTILIMGGGQGLGPIKEVVKSLLKSSMKMQLIVIAGTNQKLINWFKKSSSRFQQKLIYFEYTNNVNELMDAATLLVTKPGGITTAEALAKGLPMVIINPIPGQEMQNTQFLVQKGIGIHIDNMDNVGKQIEGILKHPEQLKAMSMAALAQGKPNAALDVAQLIHQLPMPAVV